MPFPLRLVLCALASIPLGRVAMTILDHMPLFDASISATVAAETSKLVLFLNVSLMLMGAIDGWFNRPADKETQIRHWLTTTAAMMLGLTVGMMSLHWPVNLVELDGTAIKIASGCGGAMLFFSLTHISGASYWEDRGEHARLRELAKQG